MSLAAGAEPAPGRQATAWPLNRRQSSAPSAARYSIQSTSATSISYSKARHRPQRAARATLEGSDRMNAVGRHPVLRQYRRHSLAVCPAKAQGHTAIGAELPRCRDHFDGQARPAQDLFSSKGVGSGVKQYDRIIHHFRDSRPFRHLAWSRLSRTCSKSGPPPVYPSVPDNPGKCRTPGSRCLLPPGHPGLPALVTPRTPI
jgi:hypothetical protein